MHPNLSAAVAAEHRADLLRDADRRRLSRAARGTGRTPAPYLLSRVRLRLAAATALRQRRVVATTPAVCCS